MRSFHLFKFLHVLCGFRSLISYVIPEPTCLFLSDTDFLSLLQKKDNADDSSVPQSEEMPPGCLDMENTDLTHDSESWDDFDVSCDCFSDSCDCVTKATKQLEDLEDRFLEDEANKDNGKDVDHFEFKEAATDFFYKKHGNKQGNNTKYSSQSSKTSERKKLSPRVQTKLNVTIIALEMEQRCCLKSCLRMVSLGFAISTRETFWKKTLSAQQQYIYSVFQQTPLYNGRRLFKIPCNGCDTICRKAWCTLHGISDTRYTDLMTKFNENVEKECYTQPRTRSLAFDLAKEWFRKFSLMADTEPTSGMKHLPSCLTKNAVYFLYQEQFQAKGTKEILSRSHFVHWMWKREFPNVSIPKNSRFAKCNICEYLKENLQSPRLEVDQRQTLVLMRKIHLRQQMAEREKYYLHGLKAKVQPEKYLSIILDGMDQCKTQLPHFCVNTKAEAQLQRIKTHITGALINARTESHCFIDTCEYSHDSNLTINILQQLLIAIKQEKGFLPPVLYLQLDNCARENKNRYVLAFLSLLVELKIFQKIRLSFLMVGHTHEDIDQMFSRISRYMNKNNVETLNNLGDAIQSAYNPKPSIFYIKELFDVKGWFGEKINLEDISGHSTQHQFKIERNQNGDVHVMYKKWSTNKNWLPHPHKQLKVLLNLPTGIPELSPPDLSKMKLEEFQKDLPKFLLRFKNHESAHIWNNFVVDSRNRAISKEAIKPWSFETLAPLKDVHQPLQLSEKEKDVMKELIRLYSKERTQTEIIVKTKKTGTKGKKRKRSPETNKENKKTKS